MRQINSGLAAVLILAAAVAAPALAGGDGGSRGLQFPTKAPAPGTDKGYDAAVKFFGRFLTSGNPFGAAGAFDPDGFEFVEGETWEKVNIPVLTDAEREKLLSDDGPAWRRLVKTIQEATGGNSPKATPERAPAEDPDYLPGLDDDDLPGLDD